MVDVLSAQLSWTQAHTNLINAYLAEKMAVAEYKKVTSEQIKTKLGTDDTDFTVLRVE